MPQQCCVYKCNTMRVKGTFMQSFHRFPDRERSPTRFKLWERKINRQGFKPTKYSVVCSKHFDMDDFEETSLLKRKLIPTQKFQALLKKSAYPKLYLKGETEEIKLNRPLKSSYHRKNVVEEAVASTSQDFQEIASEKIDVEQLGRVPDFDDGSNEKGDKITSEIEEMVSVKSETVWSDGSSCEEVQLKAEYEPEPHVWVKEEALVKEEAQDAAPEETREEQASHSECHPFTDELEEPEDVSQNVTDDCFEEANIAEEASRSPKNIINYIDSGSVATVTLHSEEHSSHMVRQARKKCKGKRKQDEHLKLLQDAVQALRDLSATTKGEDEIDAFTKSISAQMRKLPEELVIGLMSDIQALVSARRAEHMAGMKRTVSCRPVK